MCQAIGTALTSGIMEEVASHPHPMQGHNSPLSGRIWAEVEGLVVREDEMEV